MTFQSIVAQLNGEGDFDAFKKLTTELHSKFSDWELVLVADGHSPLATRKIVESFDKYNFVNTRIVFLGGRKSNQASAMWGGVDAAIGDRVTVLYGFPEVASDLFLFWEQAENVDVRFGYSLDTGHKKVGRFATMTFSAIYQAINGQPLAATNPGLINLSRQFISFLQKTARPEISLRNAYIYSGFSIDSAYLNLSMPDSSAKLSHRFGRATEIIFSATTVPLRGISILSLVGATLNLLYSGYVVSVSLGGHVAPGWTSMSLQLSGMFLLVTLVLAAISEFLIFLNRSMVTEAPYFVKAQLTSRRVGFSENLNITED